MLLVLLLVLLMLLLMLLLINPVTCNRMKICRLSRKGVPKIGTHFQHFRMTINHLHVTPFTPFTPFTPIAPCLQPRRRTPYLPLAAAV